MHTNTFDFVSALSAEELCPVCKELHAAVDECLCSSCQTHVCLDCSSLQPDTSWICTPCAARVPARAYPAVVSTRPAWLQVAQLRHALREHITLWSREAPRTLRHLPALAGPTIRLGSTRARAASRAVLVVLVAFYASLRGRAQASLVAARPRLHDLSVSLRAFGRASLASLRALGRASMMSLRSLGRTSMSSLRALGRAGELGSRAARARARSWLEASAGQARRLGLRVQRDLASSLRALRTLSVREHALCLVIATMMMIAVARAENGPDAP
ncbi:MAG: hypothetical protein JWN48_1083 [Myxococcaceae bacterium]|nr:hypothetical protein [Myxococcaceae bacterium]